MGIYENNMEMIKEYFPYMTSQIETFLEKGETEDPVPEVFWEKDLTGQDILGVVCQGDIWYFSSRYNSDKMAAEWCEVHKREDYFAPITIFGLGNADYLRKLRELNPENKIYVYEPSETVFLEVIHRIDLTDLIRQENLLLTFGEEGISHMIQWLSFGISFANYEYMENCTLPNYKNAFPLEYLRFQRMLMEFYETLIFQKNTLIKLEKKSQENLYANIRDCIRQHSILELVDEFPKAFNAAEIPAILVSAGPSLDKNIGDLAAAKNRAFIIGVDTAIGTLLKNGILPDLTITIDPLKDIFLFEQEGIERIPIVLSPYANHKVLQLHKGKHFYSQKESEFLSALYTRYGRRVVKLASGGSVANDAFSLLCQMGFRTIIMIGQDLAYPGNKSHASAAYNDMINPAKDRRTYFEVEDIFGNPVVTRVDMNHYRRWFENMISENSDIRVIDATEGGAKIAGTEILTLKEAIRLTCGPEYRFDEIIQNLPVTFSIQEQKDIMEELDALGQSISEAERHIKEGKEAYEKLDELNRKGKYRTREFQNIFEEITELNKWVDNDPIAALIGSFTNREEYEVQTKIYDRKENLYEEINHIVKNGVEILDAYLDKIPMIQELLPYMDGEDGDEKKP